MKTRLLGTTFLIVLVQVQLNAQPAYSVALNDYQHTYKKDLSEIIQQDTALVKFYPINPGYKVIATVEKLQGEKFFNMASSDGQSKQAIKFAVVKFTLMEKPYKLYAYQLTSLINSAEYKDNFFIPFTDATSGISSYAGGRYIDFVISDINADGTLVLDFNKAYNPYCAFRSGYSCPIPPSENELPVEIKAGEMNFEKSK
jgi:uncharacterized protein (DUF1684 family)